MLQPAQPRVRACAQPAWIVLAYGQGLGEEMTSERSWRPPFRLPQQADAEDYEKAMRSLRVRLLLMCEGDVVRHIANSTDADVQAAVAELCELLQKAKEAMG